MYQYTLTIDGMACGMCEAHVNDTVRLAAPGVRVRSSYKKGQSVIVSEQPLDLDALRSALEKTGYRVSETACTAVEKKRLFHFKT